MDNLVCSQIKHDVDDGDTAVIKSNSNTMDMSNIDFGKKRVEKRDNSTASKEDHSTKLQVGNEKVLLSLSITSEHRDLIDGMKDNNYVTVFNYIDAMDEILQDHNNGDTKVNWDDVVNISSV